MNKTTSIILYTLTLVAVVLSYALGYANAKSDSKNELTDLVMEENTGWALDGLAPMEYKEAVKEDTDRDVWNSGYYQCLKAVEYNMFNK
jgi:hypothetical protein